MNVGAIGYNYTHDADFVMSRPDGNGCWLMLFVKENSLFEIGGSHYKVKKNSVVIFSPETPCSYGGDGGKYTDDWLFFTLCDGERELISALGIPINEPFYLGRLDELSQLMRTMSFEHCSPDPHHAEIERCYAEILLYKLSDLIRSEYQPRSQELADKNYRFVHIRDSIYANPETIPDVNTLAAYTNMSRSGFQHLYKKYFGVSASSDIIKGRIEKAKQLLSCTRLSVSEISLRCGYGTCSHFMRQFREVCGKTPSEYRKTL